MFVSFALSLAQARDGLLYFCCFEGNCMRECASVYCGLVSSLWLESKCSSAFIQLRLFYCLNKNTSNRFRLWMPKTERCSIQCRVEVFYALLRSRKYIIYFWKTLVFFFFEFFVLFRLVLATLGLWVCVCAFQNEAEVF